MIAIQSNLAIMSNQFLKINILLPKYINSNLSKNNNKIKKCKEPINLWITEL